MEETLEIQQNTLQLIDENNLSFSSFEEFRKFIIYKINQWITEDFEHLLYMLYRIDVHEDKVRLLLKENKGENAAEVIADLIIERQRQKIDMRKLFKFKTPNDISEDERW